MLYNRKQGKCVMAANIVCVYNVIHVPYNKR